MFRREIECSARGTTTGSVIRPVIVQRATIAHMARTARRHGLPMLIACLLVVPLGATRADLARARSFYNARQFDQAIEAATLALRTPATAPAATVVLARAHLERYRERADPADLSA